MKALRISRIDADDSSSLEDIARQLDIGGACLRLEETPWPDFPYKPKIEVTIGHTGSAICLRYSVREGAVLAEKTVTNSQVSEDSCVELFLAPGGDRRYYNFEWNCIGTCLAGVGVERHGRELLSSSLIERVRRVSSLGSSPFAERRMEASWSLIAVIPASVLVRHRVAGFGGLTMRGNLYKCGDRLSLPHYVTWSSIRSPVPDYHRPEQFGIFEFAE